MARRDNPLRDKVIRMYIQENQPCSTSEILAGAKFANGRLLNQHKRLNLSERELIPLLRRNPSFIGTNVGGRGRSCWMWRMRR